ncbi:MAG: hypothetical protein LBR76_03180 [Oscillospiraceae bacterium]|jgi:hypothetical protein|nr:hypothetical protein [Oscillospiraceae bacterium]
MRKYFSKTVYLNTLRRFWAGALLIILFFTMLAIAYGQNIARQKQGYELERYYSTQAELLSHVRSEAGEAMLEADFLLVTGGFVVFAGVFCSILLFSFLHNKRAPVMLHALPVRREAHFNSVFLAGLTLLWGPVLLGALMFAVTQAGYGVFYGASVGWYLLLTLLCSLVAFSMTTLAAFLTGSSVGQFILTALIAALPVLLELFFSLLCQSFLFGYNGTQTVLNHLLHPVFIFGLLALDAVTWLPGGGAAQTTLTGGITAQQAGSLFLLFGYCLIAIAASLLLCRKRRLECAGEFVAVRGMRPVFRYGAAFLAAFLFGVYGYTFFVYGSGSELGFLWFGILGGAIGFFVAEMFIRKTLKVWRYWKGAALFGVCYTAVICAIMFDIFGYGSYVLPEGRVESIYLSEQGDRSYDPAYYLLTPIPYRFTGDDMQAALALQAYIAKEGERTTEEMNIVRQNWNASPVPSNPSPFMTYAELTAEPEDRPPYETWFFYMEAKLTNGKTVTRRYVMTLPAVSDEWHSRIEALNEAAKPQMTERLRNLPAAAQNMDAFVYLPEESAGDSFRRYNAFTLYGDDLAGFAGALALDNPYWERGSEMYRPYEPAGLPEFIEFEALLGGGEKNYVNTIRGSVSIGDANAIAWLRENGYMTPVMEESFEALWALQ